MELAPKGTGILARYQLGDLIGTGGMAEVLAAEDLLLHRRVAVKRLRREFAQNPAFRSRFKAEARAAARLSHPNVVQVFDIGEVDGFPFIVMEHLSGRSLADLIARGPLSETEALRIVGQVLDALSAAHAMGIVHRDVKPGNVLLADDGTAKVTDFGIAKTAELEENMLDQTATNLILGTPAYLAPERMEGREATPASDIWSVGVVLYEALAGVEPFSGETPLSVAFAARDGRVAPLETRRQDLSPAVVQAVRRAMEPNPSDRFAAAGAMALALGVAAAGVLPDGIARLQAVSGPPTQVLGWRTERVAAVSPVGAGRGAMSFLFTKRALGVGLAGLLAVLLVFGLVVGLGGRPSMARHLADKRSTASIRSHNDPTTVPSTTWPTTTTTTTTVPDNATAVVADTPAPLTTAPPTTAPPTTAPPTTAPTTTTTTAPPSPPAGSPGQGGSGPAGGGAPPAGPGGSAGAGPGQ